jgi:sarcosine oxidase subunit beta
MRAQRSVDVVVIGAGVLGCSIGLELARAGRDVVVVDRTGGVGHGSTSASSGVVRFHYSTFAGVALAWESAQAWQDWPAHLGHLDPAGLCAYERTGILVLDHDPTTPGLATSHFDAVGVPWERWDSLTITERLPRVDAGRYGPPVPVYSDAFFADPSGNLTGTFTPDAGYIADPQLAAHNLGAAAEHHGASVLLRHEVTAVDAIGARRWTVTTSGAVIATDVVVNAAGPWSSMVNALAGIGKDFAVRSRPLRQEVHEVEAPYSLGEESLGVMIADPDLGIYVRPAGNGKILVGGMEPACDPLEWLDDPDDAAVRPTTAVFEAQMLRAARRLPGLEVPNRPTGIAGVYDATPDWTPIYDRTEADGYYVAMGTSGNQFKNAPVVGHLMNRLISEIEGGHDHDRTPVKLHLSRTGHSVDLGTYSRLRQATHAAPTSVMG